jgi:hypothetical protein
MILEKHARSGCVRRGRRPLAQAHRNCAGLRCGVGLHRCRNLRSSRRLVAKCRDEIQFEDRLITGRSSGIPLIQ